jgi:hypothetical protein
MADIFLCFLLETVLFVATVRILLLTDSINPLTQYTFYDDHLTAGQLIGGPPPPRKTAGGWRAQSKDKTIKIKI